MIFGKWLGKCCHGKTRRKGFVVSRLIVSRERHLQVNGFQDLSTSIDNDVNVVRLSWGSVGGNYGWIPATEMRSLTSEKELPKPYEMEIQEAKGCVREGNLNDRSLQTCERIRIVRKEVLQVGGACRRWGCCWHESSLIPRAGCSTADRPVFSRVYRSRGSKCDGLSREGHLQWTDPMLA